MNGKSTSSRAGVALVIVLGLLALLMITGVAFTILMRIERAGASNMRHAATARQMAKGGLAYAIAAIDRDIGDKVDPGWSNRTLRITAANGEILRTQQEHSADSAVTRIAEDIFLSLHEAEDNPRAVATARVLSREAAQHLPGALRYRAEMLQKEIQPPNMAEPNGYYAQPEWIPVTHNGSHNGSIIGRYAYVVLNTTGLLDANVVHDATATRWLGNSAGEIRLDPDLQLDVMPPTPKYPLPAQAFYVHRDIGEGSAGGYGRYESLPELARKNSGLDGPALQNFGVFSYNPPDLIPLEAAIAANQVRHTTLRNKLKGQKIDISSEKKIKERKQDIIEAFEISGLSATQAKWAYFGLLDYIDEDNEPAGADDNERLNRPATEAVPLFSSLNLRLKYKVSDVDENNKRVHTMTYIFTYFFDYPFNVPNSSYGLNVLLRISGGDGGDGGVWDALIPDNVAPPAHSFVSPDTRERYEYTIEKVLTTDADNGTLPSLNFLLLTMTEITLNGKIVRQAPYSKNSLRWTVGIAGDQFTGTKEVERWCEVLDPRFNHLGSASEAWWLSHPDLIAAGDNAAFLGKTLIDHAADLSGYEVNFKRVLPNSLTEYLFTEPKALSRERSDFRMITDGYRVGANHEDSPTIQYRFHVANRPLLTTGELGYLPIGYWLTINLFDHGHDSYNLGNSWFGYNNLPAIGYHPVLDYFTVHDPEQPRRGLINLNTRNPEVLGAAFTKLPLQIEEYTPDSPGTLLSADDAKDIANWVIKRGPYKRISDIGTIFSGTDAGVSPSDSKLAPPFKIIKNKISDFGEFEREALIRNACNLFTLRGQTFTIILRADAFTPRFGMSGVKQGNVLATATAVAQIWRDTEPDAQGKHPTFVQFFKILDD